MSKGSSNVLRVSKIQITAFVKAWNIIDGKVKSLFCLTAETWQKETLPVRDRPSLIAYLQYTKDFHLENMNNNTRQYVTTSHGKTINHTPCVLPSQTRRPNRTRTRRAVDAVSIFHTTMIWSVRNVTQTIAWPNLSGPSSEVGVQFSKVYSSISCNTSATCASLGKKNKAAHVKAQAQRRWGGSSTEAADFHFSKLKKQWREGRGARGG